MTVSSQMRTVVLTPHMIFALQRHLNSGTTSPELANLPRVAEASGKAKLLACLKLRTEIGRLERVEELKRELEDAVHGGVAASSYSATTERSMVNQISKQGISAKWSPAAPVAVLKLYCSV